jgi:SMI1 / KNR4 family (SUKH-1)
MKYIRSIHDSVSDAELDELEARYKISFPESYRYFIKQHNGGMPKSDDMLMRYGLFYAVADVPSSLSSAIYEREEDHLIPFGETSNQDAICFDFRDGSIWSRGSRIADNFESFVTHYLKPIED